MYWIKKIMISHERIPESYIYLMCNSVDEFLVDTIGVLSAPVVFDAQIGRLPRIKARANAAKEGPKPINWIENKNLSPNVISVMDELGAEISATVVGTFTGVGEEHLGPQFKEIIVNRRENKKYYFVKTYIPGYESIFDGTIIKKSKNNIETEQLYAYAYIDIGYAYYINHNYDCAIENYSQAIKIDNNNAVAYYNRGWNYYLKGDCDNAITDLLQASVLKPSDVNIKKMLQIIQNKKSKNKN
jgi:tetratricopeptide (TPR) repeat protein